jgi:hypothetical protein
MAASYLRRQLRLGIATKVANMTDRYGDFGRSFGPRRLLSDLALIGAITAFAAVLALHVLVLPPAMVLPALSGALMITALGIAGVALMVHAERKAARVTCWDVSGGLYLIGCCAAALSETEGVLALMEEIRIRK